MLLIDDSELLRDRGYIDGAWTSADSGATFPVHDPASGELPMPCGVPPGGIAVKAAPVTSAGWSAID